MYGITTTVVVKITYTKVRVGVEIMSVRMVKTQVGVHQTVVAQMYSVLPTNLTSVRLHTRVTGTSVNSDVNGITRDVRLDVRIPQMTLTTVDTSGRGMQPRSRVSKKV